MGQKLGGGTDVLHTIRNLLYVFMETIRGLKEHLSDLLALLFTRPQLVRALLWYEGKDVFQFFLQQTRPRDDRHQQILDLVGNIAKHPADFAELGLLRQSGL